MPTAPSSSARTIAPGLPPSRLNLEANVMYAASLTTVYGRSPGLESFRLETIANGWNRTTLSLSCFHSWK